MDKAVHEEISLFAQIIDSLVLSLETKKEFPPTLIEEIRSLKEATASEFSTRLDSIVGWEQ